MSEERGCFRWCVWDGVIFTVVGRPDRSGVVRTWYERDRRNGGAYTKVCRLPVGTPLYDSETEAVNAAASDARRS